MIIPVRCVTCGRVLASKWREFQRRVSDPKSPEDPKDPEDPKAANAPETANAQEDPPPATGGADGLIGTLHARVLDDMGLADMCCRRHMLTNVDAMDRI